MMMFALLMLAAASPATLGQETSIPFATTNGIQDYRADGDRGLYIRDIKGQWYYARTMSRCGRLQSANTIGFEVSAADKLDRFGALRAQGWRCQLKSVTYSDAPPKKQRG
jgi:hypothetical protein